MTKAAAKARKVKDASAVRRGKGVDPRLAELVRFLARRAAEKDYSNRRKDR